LWVKKEVARFKKKVSGFRCQRGKAVTMKNYMDVQDSGQNLEVRGQKTGILLWERLPCPEPVDGQPRSYDFND